MRHDVGEVFVQAFDTALAAWLGMSEVGLCVHAETCGRSLALELEDDRAFAGIQADGLGPRGHGRQAGCQGEGGKPPHAAPRRRQRGPVILDRRLGGHGR